MRKYIVIGNLNHDGKEYRKGEKVELTEEQARDAAAAGVISLDGKEAPEGSGPADSDPSTTGSSPYDALTKAELIEKVEEREDELKKAGLDFDPNAKKAGLIELLNKLDQAASAE